MFAWPHSTLVDRVLPKSKILGNAPLSGRLKSLLTAEIREIRWLAKLSPETLKLPATPQVAEIAVFRIELKGSGLDGSLLDALDKAMAPPILFILRRPDGAEACSAAFKRPSEADASQWVTGPRHGSPFRVPASDPPPLPAAIDLGHLYSALIGQLLPLEPRAGEALAAWIERCSRFESLRRRAEQAAARVQREKQFNRKVELNRELNALRRELEVLGVERTPNRITKVS